MTKGKFIFVLKVGITKNKLTKRKTAKPYRLSRF